MNVRQLFPKDVWSVARILVALIIIKLLVNFVYDKVPASAQGFLPNLG